MKVYLGRYTTNKKVKGEWIEGKPRKIRVRIDKWDTWSMDHTLAYIVLPMLKQLKETKHGAPNTDDNDVPRELQSSAAPKPECEYDVDENHFKRWDYILDEMIWSFEQELDDEAEDQFHSGVAHVMWQPLGEDYEPMGDPIESEDKSKDSFVKAWRMVKGPNDTHTYDAEGAKKYYDRKKNGFRLFGKYYQDLWD